MSYSLQRATPPGAVTRDAEEQQWVAVSGCVDESLWESFSFA